MRNLSLLYNKHIKLSFENVVNVALDTNNTELAYVLTQDDIYKINLDTESMDHVRTLELPISHCVNFEHLSLGNELMYTEEHGGGQLFNVTNQTEDMCNVYELGEIGQMVWNPDQEIFVICTLDGKLVVKNSSLYEINQTDLNDSDFGDHKFVNVGWGDKSTQFHGTEGKEAAKQKPMLPSEDIDISKLDQTINIVWRGDGQYFLVSFVSTSGRGFKVFDKEGKLEYTSEKTVGLEAPITWRPSGNWICLPQVLPNKYIIALFEKNGLKHREIELPFKPDVERVQNLSWSSDSDVLAIETINQQTQQSTIYLYTMGNYHWYLKQTLEFKCLLKWWKWDDRYSTGKTLHILLADNTFVSYRWDYVVNNSPSYSSLEYINIDDEALVAVIDGRNLLLTNFRGAIIPPPMCGYTLKTENPINFVGFLHVPSRDEQTNAFFTIDTTNKITTYKTNFVKGANEVTKWDQFRINDVAAAAAVDLPLFLNHWKWLTAELIVLSHRSPDNNTDLHLCAFVHCLEEDDRSIRVKDTTKIPGSIGVISVSSPRQLIVETTQGTFYDVGMALERRFDTIEKIFKLPEFCENILVYANNKFINIFSLHHRQTLYIDGKPFAQMVTSMFLTEKYLVFTTFDQLKFVRLTDGVLINNERRMERGGRLVTIVPKDSKTILQMPRGNLEMIQPRVLSLCMLGAFLNDGNYHKAFDILRKQRINLNLLFDHNPDKFMSEVGLFIGSINNAHWLNLFLSDLENVDVTVTMYSSNYPKDGELEKKHPFPFEKKINLVCTKVCEEIKAQGLEHKLLLPILTGHVKQKQMEVALRLVWALKQKETASNGKAPVESDVTAQEALKYLLYLVDVNHLYNVALGTYDFGLVLFVAAKSQKDPKEYLPFLNELKNMDEYYRKYRIDLHLKRHKRALANLCDCGDDRIDECLNLLNDEPKLYMVAMPLYKHLPNCYRKIVFNYAEYLRSEGLFRDACLMYERSGDLQQAILSARHILDWQKCIELSHELGSSDEEIKQIAASLVPSLKENGNHEDAAHLLVQYQQDYQHAVETLCEGKLFAKALYVARLHKKELPTSCIKLKVQQHYSALTAELLEDFTQFNRLKARLAVVRKLRAEKKIQTTDVADGDIDCDMLSDTSSFNSSRMSKSSRGTAKTHRSSKNRRKHERKLLSLKEGNPFEDIAIIDSLHTLVLKTFNQQLPARALCKVLIDLDCDDNGRNLQNSLLNLIKTVKDSLDQIWIPEMIVNGTLTLEQGNMVDFDKLQDDQHYAMIKPHQRYKPEPKLIDWEFDLLRH